MTGRIAFLGAAALSLTLAAATAATANAAVTIGTTTLPSGAALAACNDDVSYVQPTFSSATSYMVPAGGGEITGWSVYAVSALAGVPERLVIVRPGADMRSYTVVGTDLKNFPNPIPSNGIVSFTLATPIAVQPGDELGVYNPSPSDYCMFQGGSSNPLSSYALETDPSATAPAVGSSLVTTGHTAYDSGYGFELNLAATLDNDEDAGVTAGASSGATVGVPTAFSASVTNNGPASAPITFSDTIDPGLKIDSAVAGAGTCSVSGQLVTCTITEAPGESLPVSIAVTAAAAGSYRQTIAVGTGSFPDPVTANNAASSTLNVAAPAGPAASAANCHIPQLSRVSVKIAKGVIAALGCKVGKITTARSKTVARGLVISTTPKPGSSVAGGTKIGLRVSSGRPPRKKKRAR